MDSIDKKKANVEYIIYFINGYRNYYDVSLYQFGCEKKQYKNRKIEAMMMYLGVQEKYKFILKSFGFIYLPVEFITSIFILFHKFFISALFALATKKEMPIGKLLFPSLGEQVSRLKQMLKAFPLEKEIKTVKIPFISCETPYETYSVFSVIKLFDCVRALILSFQVLVHIFDKYHNNDFLFRVYSSYEFFLTCLYVEHVDNSNRFLYVETINRWAYLFGNDRFHLNVFIQHGALGQTPVKYLKYKAPHTAYFINVEQEKYFENEIYIGKPKKVEYRPSMEFTSNDKLKNNGKQNLLVICCNKFLDKEKEYIPKLAECNRYNIYIKPHPGYKDHIEYYILKEKYDIEILDKDDYPHVSIVLSYSSTLALEYEEVGVFVIRYNDLNFKMKFQALLEGV